MTLLRALFIAGKASVKENPAIADGKAGDTLIALLDQVGEFLDSAKGFYYEGDVVMRGLYMHLVDLDHDFDDVMKGIDPRFKSAVYAYGSVPLPKDTQTNSVIKLELGIFVFPEAQHEL